MTPSFALHHGAISVSNLDESIEFYKDVLGFEVDTVTEVSDDFKIVHIKHANDYLELFWLRDHKKLPEYAQDLDADLRVMGTKHIAFISDEIHVMHDYLKGKGVDLMSEVNDDNDGYKYFFFKDINGIMFEMVEKKT